MFWKPAAAPTRRPVRSVMRLALLAGVALNGASAFAPVPPAAALASNGERACTQTANHVRRACNFEALDDYWLKLAACANESDPIDEEECIAGALTERAENQALCHEQQDSRLSICAAVGEARYDPEFEPRDFISDFRGQAMTNPYFPLGVGYTWELTGEGETVNIEILNRTKEIDDVTCLVVRDQVFVDGALVEDTDDWFALAKNGDVWYCGEEVKDYESFEDDKPALPELVSIDGSFKADRDDAKPGILAFARPQPGRTYREEFSLGNAEDVSTIISTTYGFGANSKLDRFIPEALARLLCKANCVVTHAFTAAEPGIVERKYFAPGIGFFFQVNLDSKETVQLTNCNFDPRCRTLPKLLQK